MNPPEPLRIPTHNASEAFVQSKVDFLMDIGIWPVRQDMDPYAWLKNFTTDERPFAFNLLNVFLYYEDRLVNALLGATVQRLSTQISQSATSLTEAQEIWHEFLSSTYITYVQGEDPNPTDSGLVFARKARQVLGISEERITEPQRALTALLQNPHSSLILLDDFVGSGNQMIETWHRTHTLTVGQTESLAMAARNGRSIYFAPIIATKYGLGRIRRECPGLDVRPAHVLDEQYSLTAANCILWPDLLKPDATSFLLHASQRAGIVDEYDYGWKGFHDLALGLAFSGSVPDATLPLFFWNRNGWAPLISRR